MVDIVAIDRALSTGALDEAAARIAALPVQAYEAAPAHSLAGRLHLAHGRDHAAVECFETALALDACDLWALCMLASLRKEAADFAGAADLFERAMAVAPEVPGLRYNCASALQEAGRLDAAHEHVKRLHAQEPASHLVHLLQARMHELRGELHVAQPIYRRVAESHPAALGAWSGMGRIARDQGEFAAAEAAFAHALVLEPGADFALDVGLAQAHQHHHDQAFTSLGPLLAARPGNAMVRAAIGNVRLARGDFTRGWADYEARFDIAGFAWPAAVAHAWNGRHLLGGTLVVDAEQGFGDSILAARFLRLARARAARVVFRCQAPLVALMQASGVADQVLSLDQGVNGDAHCRLLSLPHLLGLESLPAVTMPYLKPSADAARRWAGRLAGPDIAVGLVWSGLASATQNRYRMFDPAPLARLLGGRARLFGLQLPGDGVAACPPGVTDLSAELRDFGETAAALGEIDILISAETAVAHLGGALGVRTWIPMPMTADWRWRIGAVESPWYPDVRLFRQTRPMQWDDVYATIGAALDEHRGRG